MLVKIEFRTGSFLTVNAGDMFQSADKCRETFLELLNGPDRFFKFDDFNGKKLVLHKENINSVEVDYRKGAHGK